MVARLPGHRVIYICQILDWKKILELLGCRVSRQPGRLVVWPNWLVVGLTGCRVTESFDLIVGLLIAWWSGCRVTETFDLIVSVLGCRVTALLNHWPDCRDAGLPSRLTWLRDCRVGGSLGCLVAQTFGVELSCQCVAESFDLIMGLSVCRVSKPNDLIYALLVAGLPGSEI